jgi:hypothetical protein
MRRLITVIKIYLEAKNSTILINSKILIKSMGPKTQVPIH